MDADINADCLQVLLNNGRRVDASLTTTDRDALFHLLTRPGPAPDISDLRPTRRARHVSLEHAAAAVGSCATSLSRERGKCHNPELIDRYRQSLTTV